MNMSLYPFEPIDGLSDERVPYVPCFAGAIDDIPLEDDEPDSDASEPNPPDKEKPLTMYWCAVLFNATSGNEYPVHVHVIPLSTDQYDELEHLADVAIPYHTEYAIYGLNCRVVNVPANMPAVVEMLVLDQCKGDILEILMQPKPVAQSLNFERG